MTALAWIAGSLAVLAAICALGFLGEYLLRRLIHQWRNAPAGGSAFNPLQEMVQPQIRHVLEVHEHQLKEDVDGAPPVPAHQPTRDKTAGGGKRIFGYACATLLLAAGCDAAKNSPQPLAKGAKIELYFVSPTKTPTSGQVIDPATNTPVFLTTPAIITATDVATVQRDEDSAQQPSLNVTLTPGGAKKMAAATSKPGGMQVAIVVNGNLISAPKLRSPLSTNFHVGGDEIAKNREQIFAALTED